MASARMDKALLDNAPMDQARPRVLTGEEGASSMMQADKNLRLIQLCDVAASGIRMPGFCFDRGVLERIDLRGAILTSSTFEHADLSGADLSGANLDGCRFTGAILTNVNFTNASARNASANEVWRR
ncbi:hypothetical protein T484DRAFT_1768664 [Baffinella frigidus]|nr:hypothetical protein T484DRAFT_1768664 [Cryptophyta sp. CCMP2293]